MKKIVCFIICFLFLCPIVFAQESDTYISVYQQSGAEDLEETLDEEIREMIEELEEHPGVQYLKILGRE